MMKKNQKIMIKDLAEFYLKLYSNKELFNKNYFKYTSSEINKFIDEVVAVQSDSTSEINKINKEPIRDEILQLQSTDAIANYLYTNLKYDKLNPTSKDELLSNISLSELKYLYYKIYSCEVKSKMRKIDIFNSIERYFDGINRALTMKP